MRPQANLLTAALTALLLLGMCTPAANGADALLIAPAITAPASSFLPAAPAAASLLPAAAAASFLPATSVAPAGGWNDRPSRHLSSGDARWKKQWEISLAPLFVSESLDSASSYGMRELNPLLASANGGFGMKATGIKFGVIGALAGAEYVLVRKYPRSAKFFSIVNWTTAGATTGLAVHNFQLPR